MKFFDKILKRTQEIPEGQVATYGQIAALCGSPRGSRAVGWALHQMRPELARSVPWWRVINREGRISTTCLEHTAEEQVYLLKKERIKVEYRDGNYYVDLKEYLWKTPISK